MPDRISEYRQIRLVFSPSHHTPRATVLLQAVEVRKGVPHAQVLDQYVLTNSTMPRTTEEVVDLVIEALEVFRLRWHLPDE